MAQSTAQEQAIDWIIRLRDPAFADWPELTGWLAADPDHAAAYRAVSLADAEMADALVFMAQAPVPANDNRRGLGRRIGAMVAVLICGILAYPVWSVIAPTYAVETAMGEHRRVTLADGTIMDLNGGTRVRIDRRNPRLVLLDDGEASFRVANDPRHPFMVSAGDTHIRNMGTVFNVVRESGETEVSVAEGAVLYNPRRDGLVLKQGQKLRLAAKGGAPVITGIDPARVAGWKVGRLEFDAARLGDIVPDLSRMVGANVSVDPAIADRSFSGSLPIDRADPAAMERVADLLDVAVRRTDGGWRLSAS